MTTSALSAQPVYLKESPLADDVDDDACCELLSDEDIKTMPVAVGSKYRTST